MLSLLNSKDLGSWHFCQMFLIGLAAAKAALFGNKVSRTCSYDILNLLISVYGNTYKYETFQSMCYRRPRCIRGMSVMYDGMHTE